MIEKRDKIKSNQAKDIIHLIVKTFAQMKLFSLQHENVNKFTGQLFQKMQEFFDDYRELELGIEEFSFTLDGEVLYSDQQLNHSLPFLFYKDGMARLFFHNDLQKTELMDFLELVKTQSDLPSEESDIVSAMWERDFFNIRYLAPDDFLETKIGLETEVKEYTVDRDELFTGRIDLDREDQQALAQTSEQAGTESIQTSKQALSFLNEAEGFNSQAEVLSEEDAQTLEQMLISNRHIAKDEELISLLAEMLILENRPQEFSYILETLKQYHQQLLTKGDFKDAVTNLKNLNGLHDSTILGDKIKPALIKSFLVTIKSHDAISYLKEKVRKDQIQDMPSFLHYLELLGTETIPLLCDLYAQIETSDIRQQYCALLKKLGAQNINLLVKNARDDLPDLTREIISILSTKDKESAIPLLANFFSYKNQTIRAESIKALGKFKAAKVNKILSAYLSEEEHNLRILAAQNLSYTGDKTILNRVIKLTEEKAFIKKTQEEKKSLLDFLGKTQSEAAHKVLAKCLRRAGLFSSTKIIETALSAVSALGYMNTEEALKTLEKGTRNRSSKIKNACLDTYRQHPNRILKQEGKSHG